MDSAELLHKAIQAARNGHELTARELFLDVVRIDPSNEIAWMWLSGLLDPLEDRLAACERVLSINPRNEKIRAYREKLLKEFNGLNQRKSAELDAELQEVRRCSEQGKRDEALLRLQNFLQRETDHIEAWLLFAELSSNVNDKARAYETVLQNDPSNTVARNALNRLRYYQQNPLELAARYEEDGKLDKALEVYHALAAKATDSSEFERIYKNIVRLEDARIENVRHVKPALTILRLSVGLPLLYLLEILTQEGLNPIRHPAPHLWLGIPLVVLGSFLLTVAGLRVRHVIWRRWFGEQGERGSAAMRMIVAAAGLMLILAPHFLLAWDSYLRLQTFQIPAIPWLK